MPTLAGILADLRVVQGRIRDGVKPTSHAEVLGRIIEDLTRVIEQAPRPKPVEAAKPVKEKKETP